MSTLETTLPRSQEGWAEGDTLSGINNLIGSAYADTLTGDSSRNSFEGGRGNDVLEGERGNDVLEGGGGNDVLAGGTGIDTYVFNKGDGTDRVIDNGGRIFFDQGTDNDYAGATYAFSDVGSDARLTVTKSGRTLNVIEFTSGSSGYSFYTRSDGSYTRISESSFVYPPRQDGSESNPYLATAGADSFSGSGIIYDWVSYAGSNSRVIVNLRDDPATVSEGWAEGDTLSGINNLIGSAYADTLTGDSSRNSFEGGRGNDVLEGERGNDVLEGGGGNDVLAGGTGIDTYVFNAGDGTDTITDSGGSIVFEQGTDNDYAGATYAFSDVGSDARLTVTKSGRTLNVIEFTSGSSGYSFYTRSDGSDTRISTSELTLPVLPDPVLPDPVSSVTGDGSASNPYLATAAADSFTGSGSRDWVSYAGSNFRCHHQP